jgi:putative transposase
MCTFRRQDYFTPAHIVNLVHHELLRTATECTCEILAYCYMPDHVHLLTSGSSERSDALKLAVCFRQRSGYAYRRIGGGRLWQDGFFDRILRDEDGTFAVVSYIVGNPVRAGLCEAPERYPYSGSSRYALNELTDAVQWRPDSLG